MELINRIRKSRKGFTLVEIIVVLVILAVLAAFTIPSMIGFVNDAKRKAAIAEQREVYVAAQAIITENYAKGTEANLGINATSKLAVNIGSDAINTLAPTAAGFDDKTLNATQKVTYAMYNYLKNDITASGDSGDTNSYWTVKVDADGKVDLVTYIRDGIVLDDLDPSDTF